MKEVKPTHKKIDCAGEYCCFHNPSKHHMREWPKTIRYDRMAMTERICPHGIGHPDPDSVAWMKRNKIYDGGCHGCDGCCTKPSRRYIRFTEYNQWEAETWNFYVPLDHPKLEKCKKKAWGKIGWEVSDKIYTEEQVNLLVSQDSPTTYMRQHQKVKDINLRKEFYKGQPFTFEEIE